MNPFTLFGTAATVLAITFVTLELSVFLPRRRRYLRLTEGDGYQVTGVTVALTAYNDEESIGPTVTDFLSYEDTECVALCEGDMTFRAMDLTKLLAYLPHAEIVNGTRIVEQLRAYSTQLTTFMYYGNFFVGKLLEAKHFGKGTFTDVGTTYKIMRREPLLRLLPALQPRVNLEFNAHFLDTALSRGLYIVECPITFHARVGQSKGGNVNDFRAVKVGLKMILGLMFGWGGHT